VQTTRAHSIRWHLAVYALALILPLLLLLGWLYTRQASLERARNQLTLIAVAQELAHDFDLELRALIALLQSLATSPALANGDLASFHAHARAARPRDSVHMVLSEANGQQLLNTRTVFGDALPRMANPGPPAEAIATGRPQISDIFFGAVAQRRVVIISVRTITRSSPGGAETAVALSLVLDGEYFMDLIQRAIVQPIPTRVLADSKGQTIMGTGAFAELVAGASAKTPLGQLGEFTSRSEADMTFACAALTLTRWRACAAMATQITQAPLRQALWQILAAILGVTGLSALLAYWFGRRLTQPVLELADAAKHLGNSGLPHPPPSYVKEAADVFTSLSEAQARITAQTTALRQSEERLSGIVSLAIDAIISVDEEQRITLFNEGAQNIFGYSRDEVIGQPLDTLIPTRFRSAHRNHVGEFGRSGSVARRMGERSRIYGRRKDGSDFPAEASISRLEVEHQRIYTVVLRDVSERVAAERQLAEANTELERRVEARTAELQSEMHKRQEAQSALVQAQRLEAIGQLTGGVAHDFNNLLTIIGGNLELLTPRLTDEQSRSYAARAAHAADLGARLTAGLLSFARRRRLAPAVLDLRDVVFRTSELLARTLGEDIQLTTQLAPDLWPIKVDPSEVESAILNLAINARDAMPRGGRLMVETSNVRLDGSERGVRETIEAGDYVRLALTDTGVGMTSEIAARAIEPFFTTKDAGKGTGLGLSTVYGFAKQSGGYLSIYSEPGRGSTISLYLPRAAEGALPAAAPAEHQEIPLGDGETVLVVEDNAEVRDVALQRIEALGYAVREATDAESAMIILTHNAAIDIVFSDVVMGNELSGFDLARWTSEHHPRVAIVLASGFADLAARNAPDVQGRFPVLRKPYTRAELAIALADALTTARARHARSTSDAST
jgi:PAS domain S-box-containing protein